MKLPIKAITKGSNTNVSPLVHPIDQPYLMNGCNNTWKIGVVTKDTGYEIVDQQIEVNQPIGGLYNFRQTIGVEKMLATMDDATNEDTQLFYKAEILIDSYTQSNQNTAWQMSTGGMDAAGQTITGDGTNIGKVKFYLKRTGNPTATLAAKLYAHTGVWGTSGVPTGAALATSTAIAASSVDSVQLGLVTFDFTGANQINLVDGTRYVTVVEVVTGSMDGSNYIDFGIDDSAPTAAGNGVYRTWGGAYAAAAGIDGIFSLFSNNVWVEITAAETAWANYAEMNVEMEGFIGYCFMVGYGETDGFMPSASLTGTTFSTSTNVTNMPRAKFVKQFNGQLFVANCQVAGVNYPYRVYNSSFPVAGAITWTLADDFLDVGYSDQITGMEVAWSNLVVFTQYQTFFYDGSNWLPRWAQGCSAHRTIKKHKSYMLWCDFDGVQISTGGQPQNISGEIDTFYKAGNPMNYFAEVVDEQYWLYMGNITVGDVSYENLVAVFDIGKSVWWVRELGHAMSIFARFNNNGIARLYMGASGGWVFNKGRYADIPLLKNDAGVDISSTLELAPFHLDSLDRFKKLNQFIGYADKAGGVKVYARVVDNTSRILTPYKPIGELTQYINPFDVSVDDGVMLQIMLEETGANEYWSFLGYNLDVDLSSVIPKK